MLGETEKSSDAFRTASLSEMGHEQRAATSSTVTDQRRTESRTINVLRLRPHPCLLLLRSVGCHVRDRAPVIRFNERVYIPQEAHPEIGFIGMIIGPRGNSLRKIEKEVLCCCSRALVVSHIIWLLCP